MKYAVYYKGEFYKNKRTLKSAEALIGKLAWWDKPRPDPCDFYVWTTDDDGDPLKLRVNEHYRLEDMSWVTFKPIKGPEQKAK